MYGNVVNFNFNIDLSDLYKFGMDIEKITADLRIPFRIMAQVFYRYTQRRFDTSGADVGGWRKLSAITLKKKGGRGSILVDTGELREAATGGKWGRSIVTKRYLQFRIDSALKDKANKHQEGAIQRFFNHKKTVKVPQRMFWAITDEMGKDFNAICHEYVSSQIKARKPSIRGSF
jgi:phage gpG-like protein